MLQLREAVIQRRSIESNRAGDSARVAISQTAAAILEPHHHRNWIGRKVGDDNTSVRGKTCGDGNCDAPYAAIEEELLMLRADRDGSGVGSASGVVAAR